MRKSASLMLAAMACIPLTGCLTASQKQSVYQSGSVQVPMKVRLATVIDVREVEIESKPSGTGAATGAAAGAVAGTGRGRGGIIEGIAGAVIGGVAGSFAEKTMTGKKGQEIIYQADGSTDTLALVQEVDGDLLKPGDRVRLIESGGISRLVKMGVGVR